MPEESLEGEKLMGPDYKVWEVVEHHIEADELELECISERSITKMDIAEGDWEVMEF